MSAMGSIIFLVKLNNLLPAGFGDSRQVAVVRQFPEANTAQLEVADKAVDAAAAPAAVYLAGGKLRFSFCFYD
jgi:hypothetical protein